MIPDHLRIQPGQQALTPEQETEARRFAQEYIRAQLSTEPVDEPEAEACLRQAYAVAGLDPPHRIHWLDGPLQLVAVRVPSSVRDRLKASVGDSVDPSMEERVLASMGASVWNSVGDSVRDRMLDSVEGRVGVSVADIMLDSVWNSVWNSVGTSVLDSMLDTVGAVMGSSVRDSVIDSVMDSVMDSAWNNVGDNVWNSVPDSVADSVAAYHHAFWLACSRFFDVYLAPNDLHALALLNPLVSGYWLGQEAAVVVRRPRVLCRDAEGELHSATGKCLEYPDGWGWYAWHGVRVPERVIRAPERLTREDFLTEHNVEVCRVIQERMGSRFVPELGAVVIDTDSRGTLYEVELPDDPERVARYVQMQLAYAKRQYFLRVPPTIQTAAEAVAWRFQVGLKDYHPAQET